MIWGYDARKKDNTKAKLKIENIWSSISLLAESRNQYNLNLLPEELRVEITPYPWLVGPINTH